MAFLKKSNNLFLGSPELEAMSNFFDEEGFRRYIIQNSSSFGLIKNPTSDPDFNNAKVEEGTNSGTIKVNHISGIDADGLFITSPSIDNLPINNSSTQFYWVKVSHKYSAIEEGVVTIDSSGNMTGTGTKFLSKLRGQPNYPSKIKFQDSNDNFQEYEVLEVLDDNNAILQGFFIPESNLKYSVVGTFTPGVPVPNSDKFPFQYDSAEITIVPGGVNPPTLVKGKEFLIARVRNNNGVMIIEDKRNSIWEDISSFSLKSLPSPVNKFIGIESVKFDDEFSTKQNNIVELSWGLRSSNWTASNSLRQITISNGVGGKFKRDHIIDVFTNGDFNGWRLYFENGKYSKITESAIDAGAIKVTLDKLDPSDYSPQEQIFICPDVEGVNIKVSSPQNENELVDLEFEFAVNTPIAKISILVPSETTYLYNFKYRYKNNNNYSRYLTFPQGKYYAESSFDDKGILKINPADWVIKSYAPDDVQGYVELVSNSNSFSKVSERIDKGDKYGVTFRELSNLNALIDLRAGRDDFYQKIQNNGMFQMSVNQIINLSSIAKDGNEFFIYIYGPINDQNGIYKFEVRQDYVNSGNPGELIYEIDSPSLKKGTIRIHAVYDKDTKSWSLDRMDEQPNIEEIGDIKMFTGEISGRFDNTGLGISPRWMNWALMNGQNGTPDLRKSFIAGFDPADTEFNMGAIGGANSYQLGVNQLPPHRHHVVAPGSSNSANLESNNQLAQTRTGGGNSDANLGGINNDATLGRSSSVGNGEPIDNRPKYYALAFAMKIK